MVTVIPNGQPSWLGTNRYSDLDGHLEKENIAGLGPIDPKRYYSAEGQSRLHQMVEAMAWVAPFAVLSFSVGEDGYAETHMYRAQHGIGVAHAPTIEAASEYVYTITWDTSYSDSYGTSAPTKITALQASSLNNSNLEFELTSDNVITVYLDEYLDRITLVVWTNGE